MKHVKTREVSARIEEYTDSVTCDICGGKVNMNNRGEVDEVLVQHEIGYHCPDGGSGTRLAVDMCTGCFNDKLVPWLKSQGAEPRLESWDW